MVRAAITPRNGASFEIANIDLDQPRLGEVLVEIAGVGICHTDIAAVHGQVPFSLPGVLGHEGAGIVLAIGEGVTKVVPGDHVVLTFDHCGTCANCGSGNPAYCLNFNPLNGAGVRVEDGSSAIHRDGEALSSFFFGQSSFSSHALARERNVVKISKDVPLALMGPLACGVQTGAGAIMRSLAVRRGSTLLVVGAGPVGMSAVLAGVIQGCSSIIVSEPHEVRRAMAIKLGATHVIDPIAQDLVTEVKAILPEGVNYALDTTANEAVVSAVIECIAVLGSIGLVGVASDPLAKLSTSLMGIMGRGITVRGIVEGDSDPDQFIPELVNLYKEGRFPFDAMCQTYALDDINAAVDDQLTGRCLKPILLP